MDQIIKHGVQMAASLDPASQKELRATLETIFSEAGKKLDFNTNQNRASIQSLAKAFQSIFEKAGNTSIDFSELMKMPSDKMFKELGTIAATQFWDAWNAVSGSDGIGGVVNSVNKQIDALTRQRDKLMSDYEKASKMYDRYDNAMGVRHMESDEFTPLHKQKDINKQAYEVMDYYDSSLERLAQLEKGTKGYNAALLQAFESYEKLFKMKATLDLHDGPISDDVLFMYGDKQLKGLTTPFLQKYGKDMDSVGERATTYYQQQIDKISGLLTKLDGQIASIKQNNTGVINQSDADETLSKLKQIEDAYDRIINKSNGTINKPKSKAIQSALDYAPGTLSLEKLSNGYNKSLSSNEDWEIQYQWLTKFVREYEAYAKMPNADQKKLEQYRPLYEQLESMAENARNMLQNVLNMANNVPLVDMGASDSETSVDVAQNTAEAEAKARAEAEAKAKADQEAANAEAKAKADAEQAAAAEKERLAQEAAARASHVETENVKLGAALKEQMVAATKQQIAVMNGEASNAKESMSLVGSSGILSTIQGQDYAVDAATMVNQLVANLKNSIVMSLHDHPNAMDAFTPSDINSFAKLYYDQGAKVNGIIANGVIKTIDFTGISKELAIKIGQSFSANLSRAAQETGLFSFNEGNIIPKPEVDALAQSDPDKYRTIMDSMIDSVNVSLDEAFRQNGLESTVKTFTTKQLPELAQYLLEIQRTGQNAVTPIERLKNLLITIKPNQAFDWNNYSGILNQFESGTIDGFEAINQINAQLTQEANVHKTNIGAIKEETTAQEQLNRSKSQEPKPVDDTAQTQNETSATTHQIQSYEQLCQVVERYNQLVAQGGIKSPEDIGAFDDIASQLDGAVSYDQLQQFKSLLDANAISQQFGVEIPQAANSTKQSIDGLNDSLEKTKTLTQGEQLDSINVGDISSEELQAEREKVEALQNEVNQRNQNLVDKDAEITRIQTENDAKIRALDDAKLTLQNDLDVANEQIKIAHDSEMAARARADETDLKLIEKDAVIQDLEAQLAKVPPQQNDSEPKQAHWALESTLQTVKGVLEQIQTNTSKVGVVEAPNVDTIAGTTLDSKLTEIKNVLDSIDNKIAKGGIIITKDAVKAAKAEAKEATPKTQAGRASDIKSLTKDYETLGKLRAQFEKDGNLETKARLKNLASEVEAKRESLKLTTDEILSLREKSDLAYQSEKRLIDAAKAQKKIDEQRKAETQDAKKQEKDAETAWKKQVKDAQRATGINAATSAANAGDQTVLRAIGTEGVSKDIENKAKELSNRIKTLRMLRDEIDKKGEQTSAEDRDNLSKQITKVKELKTEVDGYLKIHEKYSGDNVTDLGDASNFGAVGTDQYWNNITAAIKSAASGKTTIKGLNADTGELTGTTKMAANTFAQWSATVDPLTGRLKMLRTGIKKTETLVETITRKTKEIFTYFSGSSIIFKVFNELKKGVQYVRDIDLALTELKKVTDETEETYDKFLETAAKTADKVGSTIQKVVSSTADWARLNI